jgi:16S rRNA (cytidine1402-2'-O)-methyltransferase
LHERHFWGKPEDIKKQLSEKNIQGEWCVILGASNEPCNTLQMTSEDILQLDLPKKEQARLLAKIGPKSAKEYYDDLVAAAK